jgi:hypothetical protein
LNRRWPRAILIARPAAKKSVERSLAATFAAESRRWPAFIFSGVQVFDMARFRVFGGRRGAARFGFLHSQGVGDLRDGLR